MALITFADKDKNAVDGIANKWRDSDANEVKTIVNENAQFRSRFRGIWSTVDTLPSTDLLSGDEWYLSVNSNLNAGDGQGVRPINAGTILKFISTGLWRFIE